MMMLAPLWFMLSLAYAGEEAIGEVGASVTLPDGWRRQTLSPNLGNDQFLGDRGLFMSVHEARGTFLEEADALRLLQELAIGMESQGGKALSEPTADRRGDMVHATQSWELKISGNRVAYQTQVFGQGGLAYKVLAWSKVEDKLRLSRFTRLVANRFKMPGADSPWVAQSAPRASSHEVGGHIVRFSYAPAMLAEKPLGPEDDAFVALQSADAMLASYFIMATYKDGAEAMLDGSLEQMGAEANNTRVQRSSRTIDGRTARFATMEKQVDAGPIAGAVVILPLGDDLFLDVRFLGWGTLQTRLPIYESLIASLDVELVPRVDAFPIAAPKPDTAVASAATRALLDPATTLGQTTWGRAWRRIGNEVYVQGYQESARTLLSTGESTAFVVDGVTAPGLPVRRPDGLHVPLPGSRVVIVQNGVETAAPYTASALADAGVQGILVARDPTPVAVPGFAGLVDLRGPGVVLRADSGEERLLATFPSAELRGIAGGADGALVLVNRPTDAWSAAGALLEVPFAGGEPREIGLWDQVTTMTESPGQWLVTGTPKGGTTGVYRILVGGKPELLVSGGHKAGLALDDGALLLVTTFGTTGDAQKPGINLLRVPAATVDDHGARFDPFTAGDVQRIAVDALASLGGNSDRLFADPTTIRNFVAAADKLSVARVGVPLPTDAAGVDRLLASSAHQPALQREGYLLLTALLSNHLLRQGAVWAGGKTATIGDGFGQQEVVTNHHADAQLPHAVVRSQLTDDEGWWDPAKWILDGRRGRMLVIGVDAAAVQARVDAAVRPGMRSLETKSVAELIAWLQVEPANEFLRETVYRRLAAAGRVGDLASVAAPFLASGAAVDIRVSLTARVAGAADPALIADLKSAIEAHPDDAALYMLLGRAYERAAGPEWQRYADACYAHVANNHAYSGFEADARAAIERIWAPAQGN